MVVPSIVKSFIVCCSNCMMMINQLCKLLLQWLISFLHFLHLFIVVSDVTLIITYSQFLFRPFSSLSIVFQLMNLVIYLIIHLFIVPFTLFFYLTILPDMFKLSLIHWQFFIQTFLIHLLSILFHLINFVIFSLSIYLLFWTRYICTLSSCLPIVRHFHQ